MIAVDHPTQTFNPTPYTPYSDKFRRASQGKDADILTDIYQDDTNIVVWQRTLPATLQQSVDNLLISKPGLQTAITVSPESVLTSIKDTLGDNAATSLSDDIAELVDMFCCLFGLKRAGLRLAVLDRAMCPRFHVDRVPCRLVTTYRGIATDWLPHQAVNREKLGAGNNGLPDHESGLYKNQSDIQQLGCGDVALLKGELWEGNENAGLVHRSPALPDGQKRLLLTLDFSS